MKKPHIAFPRLTSTIASVPAAMPIVLRMAVLWVLGLLAFQNTACGVESAPDAANAKPFNPYRLSGIQGMWVWNKQWIETELAQDQLLAFCQKHGFNRLLVQVHKIPVAGADALQFPRQLKRLIHEATQRNIAVEALDGAMDMALESKQPHTLRNLDVLIDFNQTLPENERFVGIHYDIEPYALDHWAEGGEARRVIMHDLLVFYRKARQRLNDRGSKMLLSCDIPMWYDEECILEFNGQTKNLHQHIQDICDYVGIMSYRTKALGPNSVGYHVANEMAYAEKIGKKVCPALETIEIKDTPEISFHGSSPATFWNEFNLVVKEHRNRKGFAGLFVHCYGGVRDLLGE